MKKNKRKIYEGEVLKDYRELVDRYKTRYANNIAFEYKKEVHDKEHIKITYAEFARDIEALGSGLLTLDFINKRVAIISPNRYEWCTSYLAVGTAGLIVVPLDKSLPNNEIESLIVRSKVEAVIFDKKYAEVFNKIKQEETSNLKYYICMDNLEDFTKYGDILNKGKKLLDLCITEQNVINKKNNSLENSKENKNEVKDSKLKSKLDGELNNVNKYLNVKLNPNEISIILFTSGTTSIAKAVALSQSNICADITALSQIAKIYETDRFLSFLPLHHTFESTTTFLYGTSCGITIVFCDGLKYIQKNLKEFNITGFVCVPLMLEIMYKKMMKTIEEQGKSKLVNTMRKVTRGLLKIKIDVRRKVFKQILEALGPNLRMFISGGAAISVDAIKAFRDIGINLLQGYGLTETSPVLAGENDKYKRDGSVGFALPGIEIKIDNPNNEGIGEIIAKGPIIMHKYLDNEEATKEVLKDGWFYTGDLGKFDKDGFLFVTGRKKYVIVLKNGKNIFPEELEILINKLDYVSECMVFGKPDKEDDLKICAKIVYNKEIMEQLYPNKNKQEYHNIIWQDIRNNINKQMPAYKYIREIIVTDEPLIKTTTQKVKRNAEMEKILSI